MRKLMMLALAVGTVIAFSSNDSMAQDYQNSYRFGVGLNYGYQFPYPNSGRDGIHRLRNRGLGLGIGSIGVLHRQEAPPYFAQYPPVYYNGIVSRPYGVSPYAAPPGIAPVEMTFPVPQAIHNPYFDQEVAPASNPVETTEPVDNKTTHVFNPYVETLTRK